MGAKIEAKLEKIEKRGSKNRCQKVMSKTMSLYARPGSGPGPTGLDFGAGGGVRRGFAPPVTGGSGFEPLRSKNALHPAGCDGKNLCKNEVGKNDAKIR